MQIRHGCSRRVLLFCGLAFKFAKGRYGRLCNEQERGIWARNKDHPTRGPRLCPVLFCSPNGRLLIMPVAKPVSPDFSARVLDVEGDWWDYMPGDDSWPCEPKSADWGVYQGRIVAVDYAANAMEMGS